MTMDAPLHSWTSGMALGHVFMGMGHGRGRQNADLYTHGRSQCLLRLVPFLWLFVTTSP